MSTHSRMLGDTLKPLNSVIYYGADPLELSTYTVKFQMEEETTGTSTVAESTTGVNKQPTQTFTVDTTRDVLKCDAHGIEEREGRKPQVVLATSLTIPAGLTAGIRLFPINITPNEFQVALTPDGPAIDITSAGAGTHTFYEVGSVQKTFLAADVDEAKRYRAWWTVYIGSDRATAPVAKQGITVEIVAFGD